MNNLNLSKSIIHYLKNVDYRDKNEKIKLINIQILINIYTTYLNFIKKNGHEMFDIIENEEYFQENDGNNMKDDLESVSIIEEHEYDDEDDRLYKVKKNSGNDCSEPPDDDGISENKKK